MTSFEVTIGPARAFGCGTLDPQLILPRGEPGGFDGHVVGDPCIVWDADRRTWRMYYFAQGYHGSERCGTAGVALSRGPDDVGPGDWEKQGELIPVNRESLIHPHVWHKWWVVMDDARMGQAAVIDGRYWALFVAMPKHLQAAWSESLDGPWHVVAQPILSPTGGEEPDGRHCDAPTAYWLADRQEVLILYMAYPKSAQAQQPHSPLGSASMAAWWRPGQPTARRIATPLLRPEANTWASGWLGGMQLFPASNGRRCALLNASPTPPKPGSHGEPAPSLGGWAVSDGNDPIGAWRIDQGPLLHVHELSTAQRDNGLGHNFWRHFLHLTANGMPWVYFNSGSYGQEQLYGSRLPAPPVSRQTRAQ